MAYRIFVFEDNSDLVALLGEIFRLKGDQMLEFSPGISICKQVEEAGPDVILVDLRMNPGGREIIREIKSDELLRKIPVLLFTAANINAAEIKAMGADGIIHKPFSLDEIERTVDNAIKKSKRRHSAAA